MILSTISLTIKLNVNIELFIFHGELDKKLNAIFVQGKYACGIFLLVMIFSSFFEKRELSKRRIYLSSLPRFWRT